MHTSGNSRNRRRLRSYSTRVVLHQLPYFSGRPLPSSSHLGIADGARLERAVRSSTSSAHHRLFANSSSKAHRWIQRSPYIVASGAGLSPFLEHPSKLASLAGLSHGEVVLQHGETFISCMNRWIARKAYRTAVDLLPVIAQIEDAEMIAFMPYLVPSTTKIELPQLHTLCQPLQWPSSLTTLVIPSGQIFFQHWYLLSPSRHTQESHHRTRPIPKS